VWLNEYAEPIKLFMIKTGISYRRIKKYVHKALLKLLGEKYELAQRKLAVKCCGHEDLLFKPKSKQTQTDKKIHHHNAGKTITPSSKFGKKYVAHYGYGSIENKAQYYRERKIYLEIGRCSWE
jgi:hypothetical protein